MPVTTSKWSERILSATTISSSEAFPARSPRPLTVHSTWSAPACTAASEFATASPRSSDSAGKSRDGGLVERGGDRADALEVAGGRAREARLDDVHAEPLELLRDGRLLVRLQSDARRLLAVAQRRIEDLDPAGHEHFLLGSTREGRTCGAVRSASAPREARVRVLSPLGENEDDDEENEPGKGRNAGPSGRDRPLRAQVSPELVESGVTK